jgi:hypothetical protein
MRLSKIIPLIFLIILIVINRIGAQCDGEVDGIIPIDEFPHEINGNTVGGGDDFIVSDLVGLGFSTEDRIYKLTLGSTDTLSLYVDMCRDGVTFDASIAIIKADGLECNDAISTDFIITHDGENIDSGALCPQANDYSTPAHLPIARDIYLDEPGDYYIVIDGHFEGNTGAFSMLIGEVTHFAHYNNLQPQNQFVDIEFSSLIFCVIENGIDPWTIGWSGDGYNYFQAFDEYNNDIQIGTLLDVSGEPLAIGSGSNFGCSAIRFPLINPPTNGSEIRIVPVGHNFFIFDEYGDPSHTNFAPHPVNSDGIPFSYDDEMEIELNELSVPEIDSLYNLSWDNETFNVIFSEGVYSSKYYIERFIIP